MIERISKRYVSCPVCGKTLMKCQGSCNIEITCIGCKQELVVQMDDEKIAVLQNRRGVERSGHAGCVMVSKKRNKPPKILINTEAPAVNC